MTDFTKIPDSEAEELIFGQLQSFDEDERLRYSQIGLMCQATVKRMLWRSRLDPETGYPCRSFSRWLRLCCPYAYSTCYSAMRDVDELQDVAPEEIAQIPQSNLGTMRQLSSKVRKQPEVLEAAKSQSSDAFKATIREIYPSQHISDARTIRFQVEEPDTVESVIEEAIENHDALDRGHALTMICEMARVVWKLEREVENRIRAACDEVID